MKFTGERVIPGECDADLFNEHRARYLFAQRFSSGKNVLDAACGSGYGSVLLAENAQEVLAVDIEQEAVEYARQRYRSPRLHFAQADCLTLPCPAARFDLVVAFEIIEHLQNAGAFLREMRRVLHPSGIFLLSTPNRLYYTDDRGEVNPFHVREFSFPELQEFLQGFFPHCSILFENHVPSLVITASGPEGMRANISSSGMFVEEQGSHCSKEEQERSAHFMIAICSSQPLTPATPLLYLPTAGNVLREREQHIRQLQQQVFQALNERDAARARIQALEAEFEERTRWALDLQQHLDEARAAIQKLQQEFEERTAWALQLDRDLQFLQGTRWQRLGRKIGLSPLTPSEQPARKAKDALLSDTKP